MGIDAGRFRHRISIDDRVQSQDDFGDPVVQWVEWASNIAAAVEPLSGKEVLSAAQALGTTTVRIIIRYIPGIAGTMRIRHGDAIYDIQSVLPDKESGREYITFLATSGAVDG